MTELPSELAQTEARARMRLYGQTSMETPLIPTCPECGSSRVTKSATRCSSDGSTVQRYICKVCGFRFSDPNRRLFHKIAPQCSRKPTSNIQSSQVGVFLQEAKNLTNSTAEIKTVGGERGIDKSTAKGLLLQFSLWLDKEGYGENCRYVSCIRMLTNSNYNVFDPEQTKAVIASKKWKNGTKMQACYAYDALAKMLGMTWAMPTYRQEEYLFFLPEEAELDALISASRSRRMTAYLQTLKETYADPSEALGLRWIDVDANRNVICINKPVKNHRPRELEVTPRLISMLNALPKTSELVFHTNYRNMQATFIKLRKRVAHNLHEPRILSISFVSFRHWGGTHLAWLTNGNVLIVKEKLGHKNINSTMKYIARIKWKFYDDFEIATATTDEEIKNLGASGYQKYDERTLGATHVSYYRRPKRFGSLKV